MEYMCTSFLVDSASFFYRATAMLSAGRRRVCLSVCLSHSGIVSKRLNVESRK